MCVRVSLLPGALRAVSPVPQLEQMDVEIHDMPQAVRPQMKQRVESYRKELNRLKKEFVSTFPICMAGQAACLPSLLYHPSLLTGGVI